LLRSIIESLTNFVGELEYGDTVANTIAKTHLDYKSSDISIAFERRGKVEGTYCIHEIRQTQHSHHNT